MSNQISRICVTAKKPLQQEQTFFSSILFSFIPRVCSLSTKINTQSNQIFHYTRCIAPQPVKRWRAHLHVIATVGNTALFEEMSQRWRVVGNTVSNLRFEPRTRHVARGEQGEQLPHQNFSLPPE